MKNRAISIIIISALIIMSSCASTDVEEKVNNDRSVYDVQEYDSESTVPVELDENGNPTGDYAKYLWDQQQMEEAEKSMVEDALRQWEEEYMFPEEENGFPL